MRHTLTVAMTVSLACSPWLATSAFAQRQAPAPGGSLLGDAPRQQTDAPTHPAPRAPGGRVLLGAAPDRTGLWVSTVSLKMTIATMETVPFQPWARALYADRQVHELEPHSRCQASGVTRPFETPYGVEFVELPDTRRVYIFDVGGPHSYRTVYMDGRTHPASSSPTAFGHSVGWWESDTLVVDTTGYTEGFWLDRRGVPHTDQLHTLERFTRTSLEWMRYEVTIDDPGAYTAPWKGAFDLRWEPDLELFEYICQQGNRTNELVVNRSTDGRRTPYIVP